MKLKLTLRPEPEPQEIGIVIITAIECEIRDNVFFDAEPSTNRIEIAPETDTQRQGEA
jgi:hypothetical protein